MDSGVCGWGCGVVRHSGDGCSFPTPRPGLILYMSMTRYFPWVLVACAAIPVAGCAMSSNAGAPAAVVAYYQDVDDWNDFCHQMYVSGNNAGRSGVEQHADLIAGVASSHINASREQIAKYLVAKCRPEYEKALGSQ